MIIDKNLTTIILVAGLTMAIQHKSHRYKQPHRYIPITTRQTDARWTNRQTNRQTRRQTDKETNRQTEGQTDRRRHRLKDRQTKRQTVTHLMSVLKLRCTTH